MFCPNCGNQIADGSAFCPQCGQATNTAPAQNPAYQQPTYNYQQPTPNYQQPTYNYQQAAPIQPTEQMSMKWYKFMIYFALFAGAVLNIITAVTVLNGSHYGSERETEMVYALFEDLKTWDTAYAIMLFVVAALGILTRFQLSGYKKTAVTYLTLLYAADCIFALVYVFGVMNSLPEKAADYMDFTSFYASLARSIVFMIANIAYFKKRSHLFVN